MHFPPCTKIAVICGLLAVSVFAADPLPVAVFAIATWYEVPPGSIPRRRAAPGEMTAAHNKLPMGTLVRVTSETNGRSVVVRITDRGVPKGGIIDLSREAADEILLVGKGRMKVRLEVLPN